MGERGAHEFQPAPRKGSPRNNVVHHDHFAVYALNVPSLHLQGDFSGESATAAIRGKLLAHGRTHAPPYHQRRHCWQDEAVTIPSEFNGTRGASARKRPCHEPSPASRSHAGIHPIGANRRRVPHSIFLAVN